MKRAKREFHHRSEADVSASSTQDTVAEQSTSETTAKTPADGTPVTIGHKTFSFQKHEKPRKLTKKAKESLEGWHADQQTRNKMRDAFFLGMAANAKNKFGNESVFAGNEINTMLVGIPMPSFALEYMIENDVFPLSLVMTIVGKWGSCKSALLYDIFRWFANCGGGAILNENETKFSDDLCSSIIGIDVHSTGCPITVNRCRSLEDWQNRLTYFVADTKAKMRGTAEQPGPGRTFPVCFAVDSVMGKSSEEKQVKVQDLGHSERGGPVEALKITDYMTSTSHEFDNWPFSLILINHLKKKVSMNGERSFGNDDTSPGGDNLKFQKTFEWRTTVWKQKIETETFDGIGIKLTCTKNSIGVTGRSMLTRMLWWDEQVSVAEGTNRPIYKRHTMFDWNWATTRLLHDLFAESPKAKKRCIAAGFDIAFKSPEAAVDCMARSTALGMGKDTWESFNVVGKMIQSNPDIMDLLRNALSIKRRAVLDGDYLKQLESTALR